MNFVTKNLTYLVFEQVIQEQGDSAILIMQQVCRSWQFLVQQRFYKLRYSVSKVLSPNNTTRVAEWILLHANPRRNVQTLNAMTHFGNKPLFELATSHCGTWGDEQTCTIAAKVGALDILQTIYAKAKPCCEEEPYMCEFHMNREDNCCVAAAENGHLYVLQWLVERVEALGCWNFLKIKVFQIAATRGDLKMVKWLISEQARDHEAEVVIGAASKNGHLDILQFCHHDSEFFVEFYDVCKDAATNGHLHVLQWAAAEEKEAIDNWIYLHSCICDVAASAGHLHILQWWLEERGSFEDPQRVYSHALSAGHLELLPLIRDHMFIS